MDAEGNSPRGIYGGEMRATSDDLPYTFYPSNAGEWWGQPRNEYGFELAPPPRIPYLLWPIAIVGALVFAHWVNQVCKR